MEEELIENKHWSIKENQSLQFIIGKMKLTQHQKSTLNEQIQKFLSSEKILLLLENFTHWDKLQECIMKEISEPSEIKQDWALQQNLQQASSYQIQSEEEIKGSIQFVQKNNINRKTTRKETNQQLVDSIFEQSQIEGIQELNTNQNDTEQTISDLFKEFNSINQIQNQQLQQLLQIVYSKLENQKDLDLNFINFKDSSELLFEDLIFLCLKVKEHFSFFPRPVQLLSVIQLYNHNTNEGRLAQIYTGEGKTLIIAMLAILLNQKKKSNVDVVTSSPVLAIRDAEQLKRFYNSFSVEVSHNISESKNYVEGVLPCYYSKVIYGDPHSFQADILRHEYSERGTMGNRNQEYIIVDEVDSMLIDGNSNKTILSSPTPGMLDLTKVLKLIWDEICKIESNLSTENKVMIIDQEKYYSVDLKEYIESTLNHQLEQVLCQFIPKFRLNFIEFMKKAWIKNAIYAKFDLCEDIDYRIENNNVRIIDYQNTGVIHKDNMHWDKGLHQFIELKHDLPPSPLTINTNYLSNVTFFKRYKNKILGLTGTLGSKVTQNLLTKHYNIDLIFMPPYKRRLLKEETGFAKANEEEWKDAIFQAVQQQMNKKRAVLIINRTIQDVDNIQLYLEQKNLKSILLFDDTQKLDPEIKPNTLIIATNLAGRGTDLLTNKELEDNGGLHVILSFLPRNVRIQEQAFGRTGRQGNKGTAQLIINWGKNFYFGQLPINTIEDAIAFYLQNEKKQNFTKLDILVYLRNTNEQFYSDQIELEMKRLENEDRCFEKFCKIAKSRVNFQQNRFAFQALEEKWGLYLEEHQETGLNEKEIEEILRKDDDNPKYFILQGLQNDNLSMFKKAISIQNNDPSAYYYQGIYEIKQNDVQKGIESLEKAKQLFNNKIDDEKGFLTAFKLNRSQIEQYSKQIQKNLLYIQEQTNFLPKKLKFESSKQEEILNKNNSELNQHEITNQNHLQQTQNNEKKLDNFDKKVLNHIKVYEKIIQNIDQILDNLKDFNPEQENLEVTWTNLNFQDKNNSDNENRSSKDKEEVINDGPLPKLGQIIKTKKQKKKRKWLQYLGLFFVGVVKFFFGLAISAFTCGAALPIGKTLIMGGLSDMVNSVTAAWKKLDIDWGAWGKEQMINIVSALVLAGPSGIKETLEMGCKGVQSLKKIGITEFLKQIPSVTADGLEKVGFWLNDTDQKKIQNQYQILQQIQETVQQTKNTNQILNLANTVLSDKVRNGTISEITSQNLYDLVNQCFQQSKGDVNGFHNRFYELATKYIRLEIAKTKTNKSENDLKKEVVEICTIQGNKKYNGLQKKLKEYKIYETSLNNEIQQFSKIFYICYSQDHDLQKIILTLDLYLEKCCNPQDVLTTVNSALIQQYLKQKFDINRKEVQDECNKLDIPDKSSIDNFYLKVIRPKIKEVCNVLGEQCLKKEPIEIILQEQYIAGLEKNLKSYKEQVENLSNKFNQISNSSFSNNFASNSYVENCDNEFQQFQEYSVQVEQIMNLQSGLLVQNAINYIKKEQMINNDGITVSNQFMYKFNNYLNQQNYCNLIIQIMNQAMESTLQELENLRKNSKKTFANALLQAVEKKIIGKIEKSIFKSRIKKQASIITSQYE